ncbi:hypothetical protein [Rhodovulum steppense]|uniref:Uncharacterized protein n=1 Tax=Rhodovulum steppense TaxID=540251 RepID=A0A4R1YMN7_9RHOB|nr:hypothetical protein [Rhodovulum steppense]TCM78658.1 hypothetical protein EV216_12538 [Rhodovulum steppense]
MSNAHLRPLAEAIKELSFDELYALADWILAKYDPDYFAAKSEEKQDLLSKVLNNIASDVLDDIGG